MLESCYWLKVVIGFFIITNGTMVDYAKKRIKDHIGRFTKLYYQIKNDEIDENFLFRYSGKKIVYFLILIIIFMVDFFYLFILRLN